MEIEEFQMKLLFRFHRVRMCWCFEIWVFKISWWSSAGKELLSSWLPACALLYLMLSLVFVFLSLLVSLVECGIWLYRFPIIAFSSAIYFPMILNSSWSKHWIKTSLTFKCLIEHLLADFSYSRPLDTYLWKQMMKMNRNITYKWCNIDKKHLLFTKRKCHKFSWLFTASRCSPRRRSVCACRIACKVLVSIGL